MTLLVFTLVAFLAIGAFFLFFHLLLGKMVRPARPDDEKLTIYECGEPTVGSAWIQFDLRYYVVALLFVIFDVEVAFFSPWAVVFGQTNQMSREISVEQRQQMSAALDPGFPPLPGEEANALLTAEVAKTWAWISFVDILVFFGVLMMGFAYLWRRGDIDWVRATTPAAAGPPELPLPTPKEAALVGAAK